MHRMRITLLLLTLCAVLTLGCRAQGAADPGTLVVLTHPDSGEVRFLNVGSGRITGKVAVGGEPVALLRDTARGRVYVADRAGDSVTAVDVVAQQVVQSITVGQEPTAMALSRDGGRLYVAVAGAGQIAVVDTEALRVGTRINSGGRPVGVAIAPDGGRVYVANGLDNTVTAFDSGTARRLFRPVSVPNGVGGKLAISDDGATLLVARSGRTGAATLNLSSRQVTDLSMGDAGSAAYGGLAPLGITLDGQQWVLGLTGADKLMTAPVRGDGGPRLVTVSGSPTGFAIAPGGRLLVASRDGEALAEVDIVEGKVTRNFRIGQGYAEVAVFSKAVLEDLRN